jgi:hypothetical protein
MSLHPDRCRLLPGVLLTLTLAACDNLDRPPDDTPPPPPAPTVSLTVSGKLNSAGNSGSAPVTDGAVAGAAIEVVAGSQRFTGSTDDTGDYSVVVTVPEASAATLGMRITGRRPADTGLAIRFVSDIGSVADGLARAGADRVLTVDEDFRVNVTPLTTAEVALLDERAAEVAALVAARTADSKVAARAPETRAPAAIGTPPDDPLETLRRSLDYQQMLDAATTIALVVDRGVAAPEDAADTFDLVATRDLRQSFIDRQQQQDPALFVEVRNRLLANRAIVAAIDPADLPAEAVTAVTGDVDEAALYGNGGSFTLASRIGFGSDGSGRYSASALESDSMRWQIGEAGTIELRFDPPASYSVVQSVGITPGSAVDVTCTTTLLSVDLQPAGPNSAVETRREVRTCVPETPFLEFDTTTVRTVLFTAASTLPVLTADDVAGRTLIVNVPLVPEAPRSGIGANESGDLLSFGSDRRGNARFSGLGFDWSISALGELDIVYSNGRRSTLRPVRAAFTGATQMLVSSTIEDGRTYTGGSLLYEVNDDLRFDPGTVTGTYYLFGIGGAIPRPDVVLPDGNTRPATLAERRMLKGIGPELFPSGIRNNNSDQLFEDADGVVRRQVFRRGDVDFGSYWRIRDDGDLIVRRYLGSEVGSGVGCGFDGTGPGCALTDQFEITPVFRHGDKLGWLQRIGSTIGPDGRLTGPIDQSIRFLTQAPLGDFVEPRTDAPTAMPSPTGTRPGPATLDR